MKIRIGVLLAYESSPYAGVVRPFLNWARKLTEAKEYEVEFLLLKAGEKIAEVLSKTGFSFRNCFGSRDLTHYCSQRGYDIVFADDYIERLKILEEVHGEFRKMVYAQVLYGLHAISHIHKPLSLKEKLTFSAARLIPFSVFKQRYAGLLGQADVIIANSQSTLNLLRVLYDVEPNGVIYPPVDTEIFKPHESERLNQVLLYLGSNAGDTGEDIAGKICKILQKKNFEVFVIGNKTLKDRVKRAFKVTEVSDVSDEELAELYSRSRLTICPQKWEQFGYLVAESITCGTPVVAFNHMGPAEIIAQTKLGFLANNDREFLKILENTEHYLETLNSPKKNDFPFSIQNSTKELVMMLKSGD